jgi:hypothetical protein
MELVDLALNQHPAPATDMSWPWYGYVASTVSAVVLIGLPIGFLIYSFVSASRRRRAAQFKGPALTGTAQVLSAAREGGLGGLLQGSHTAVMCRIGLRVEIPGRPQYDVTVSRSVGSHLLVVLCVDGQRWEPGQQWQVKPGMTFPVQVDSANPENVRIDFSSALPAARRRMYWVQWGIFGIVMIVIFVLFVLRFGSTLTGHGHYSDKTTTVHGNLDYGDSGAKETIACNDGNLKLEGDNNKYTITGRCLRLDVFGNANHVTVDSADTISVSGDDNAMIYHSGSPTINKTGNNNTVSQG